MEEMDIEAGEVDAGSESMTDRFQEGEQES